MSAPVDPAAAATTLDDAKLLINTYVIPFAIRLAVALLIFWIGRFIVRLVARALDRLLDRGKVDVSLRKFLFDLAYAVMLVAVVIASLDTLGIKTTALVAVLGAAGLAVGLALQGALSHVAAGVMLIVLRPYKVGDLVKIGLFLGRVDAIRVFSTAIITADNRTILIPNGQVIGQPIENLTALGMRRIDLVVSIACARDAAAPIAAAKELIEKALAGEARILASPPPSIDLADATDASFRLYLRPWSAGEQYAEVMTSTIERVRVALATAGLQFSVGLPTTTVTTAIVQNT